MSEIEEVKAQFEELEKRVTSPFKLTNGDRLALIKNFIQSLGSKIAAIVGSYEKFKEIIQEEEKRVEQKEKDAEMLMRTAKRIIDSAAQMVREADEKKEAGLGAIQKAWLLSEETRLRAQTNEALKIETQEAMAQIKTARESLESEGARIATQRGELEETGRTLLETSAMAVRRLQEAEERLSQARGIESSFEKTLREIAKEKAAIAERERIVLVDEEKNKKERDNINAKEKNLEALKKELLERK